MELSLRTLRFRLQAAGLLPNTRLARAACYFLGLDLLLFALQKLFGLWKVSWGQALSGWVGILSFLVIVLLGLLAIRWLKAKLLWRLRNRLIVTYVFIGVIPVVLVMTPESLEGLKRHDTAWATRQICAWKGGKPLAVCNGAKPGETPFTLPSFLSSKFGAIVRDHDKLCLRVATEIGSSSPANRWTRSYWSR